MRYLVGKTKICDNDGKHDWVDTILVLAPGMAIHRDPDNAELITIGFPETGNCIEMQYSFDQALAVVERT